MDMSLQPWAIWCVALPLLAGMGSFMLGKRAGPRFGLAACPLIALATAALVVQLMEEGAKRYSLGGWGAPLGIEYQIDGFSALMLVMTTVVGLFVSVYAWEYFRTGPGTTWRRAHKMRYFWPLWLFLWAALHGLFLSADLFNIYVTLEIIGLTSVALIALAGAASLPAAMRYLFVSLAGSLFYLFGVMLLYSAYGELDLGLLARVVEPGPVAWVALGMMTVGMLLKTALFPLHFWLPPAHANAPAPISAILSGLVVKASFYVLARLWLGVFSDVVTLQFGQLLGAFGAAAIVWGSVQALRQKRLKMLVAYSTVAQLGYLFIIFPMAKVAPALAWSSAAFFAISHACAKGALFMAAGTIARALGHDELKKMGGIGKKLPITLFTIGLAGVSLMGLPPSGGYIAKWLILTAATREESWFLVVVIHSGGLLAAAYIFRIVQCAFSRGDEVEKLDVPRALVWAPFGLAVVAIALGIASAYPLALLEIGNPFDVALDVGVEP
ncbi:MAG: complex I subunit 5 family protein [Bradymonadaceae bacterium]